MQEYIITYYSTLVHEWITIEYSGSSNELNTFLEWLKPIASKVQVDAVDRAFVSKQFNDSYYGRYGCEDYEVSIGEI